MFFRAVMCCLAMASLNVAAEPVKITWLINDFPPFSDVTEESPGVGIADEIIRYLQQHLPQYEHEFQVATFARVYALMRERMNVCHATTLKLPGRSVDMYFSKPVLVLLPQQVLVNKGQEERFAGYLDSDGRVIVSRLMSDSSLVTAISEQRGYSASVNHALASLGPQTHILQAGTQFQAPFKQLKAGWIDYMFAYPVETNWYESTLPVDDSHFVRYEIAGDPPYMLGYVACSHNEWGRKVIESIDEQLRVAPSPAPWTEKMIEYTQPAELPRYKHILDSSLNASQN